VKEVHKRPFRAGEEFGGLVNEGSSVDPEGQIEGGELGAVGLSNVGGMYCSEIGEGVGGGVKNGWEREREDRRCKVGLLYGNSL